MKNLRFFLSAFFKIIYNFSGLIVDVSSINFLWQAEANKLSNQARFIKEKCDGKLVIENKKKKLMIEELVTKGYESDPIKAWKKVGVHEIFYIFDIYKKLNLNIFFNILHF